MALFATACTAPRWDEPELAYASFARLVKRGGPGDWKMAYEALSEPTRSVIEARSKQISQATGGAVKDDPVLLTFATGVRPAEVTQVKVLDRQDSVATVSVT